MRRILIASSKGGCGKTTLTTNLAVALAHRGQAIWVIDADIQGSTRDWAEARGKAQPAVPVMDGTEAGQRATQGWALRTPPTTEVLLIDTPAGLRIHEMAEYLRRADTLLVPMLASAIDARATRSFLAELGQAPAVRSGQLRVGLVANRVKARTLATRELQAGAEDLPFPLVASLRDSQAYVLMAALGRGVFDYRTTALQPCRDEWAPLLDWLFGNGTVEPAASD